MEPQAARLWVPCTISLHDLRPHAASGPELGDLLEEVRTADEIEGQPGREIVDIEAGCRHLFEVAACIGHRERQFLYARCACLVDVVTTDVDGVVAAHVLRAVNDCVPDYPQRR